VRLWAFCFYQGSLKTTARHSAPLFITLTALALVCAVYLIGEATKDRPQGKLRLDLFDRLECITYDGRVRMAAAIPDDSNPGKSLGTLFIDDEAIERANEGAYSAVMAPAWDDGNLEELEFSAPWPRFLYGQMVRELKAQGAKAVGFDIFFSELSLRSPTTDVTLDKTNVLSSDEFLAHEIAEAGNVVLATEGNLLPRPLFAEGAAAIANISSTNDYAVLRRVRAFGEYKVWHPLIEGRVKAMDLRLKEAAPTKTNRFVLKVPRIAKGASFVEGERPEALLIPLHPNGNLKLTKDGELNLDDDPKEMSPDDSQPPYTFKKAWNLGIAMAAMQLGLDLDQSVVEPKRIILRGTNGVTRVIPTDDTHAFYIDWKLRWEDIKSKRTGVVQATPEQILGYDFHRQVNHQHTWKDIYTNRLVIIGSVATGNNLTDLGATPLEERTPLVTKHLNVANSILEGRFVKRTSTAGTILFIFGAGGIAGILTWRSKVVHASIGIGVIALLYIIAAFAIYIQTRNWIPIVMPVFGGLLVPHFCLVTYRVMFEQKTQRHLKSVFVRLVAPEVVNELLSKENLSLGGARRELTVYFADVRGFTEFTDRAQKDAEAYVKKHNLSGKEAEAYFDRQAEETLHTVNLYLSTIAEQIKKHKGTLDKFIGDCVMAFWGAPLDESKHALCAVRCAIDAQRAMYAVNVKRAQENDRRKAENVTRDARGEEPLPLLPVLQLGTGINTGSSTVGLMGGEHASNYTVFGVEVNLASRLEGVSGRGRIIVSQRTYDQVKAADPELAATFIEQAAVTVKGISTAVRIYEVPWKEMTRASGPAPVDGSALSIGTVGGPVAAVKS
jgi:class 3 adenylate cyclase/CHASE2 domain-containing sensor protein